MKYLVFALLASSVIANELDYLRPLNDNINDEFSAKSLSGNEQGISNYNLGAVDVNFLRYPELVNTIISKRDELVLKSFAKDINFALTDQGVVEWQKLEFRQNTFLIGRTLSTLYLIKVNSQDNGSENHSLPITQTTLSLNRPIKSVSCSLVGNHESEKVPVVLVAVDQPGEILWFKIASDTLHKFWVNRITNVSFLKIFRNGDVDNLLILREKHDFGLTIELKGIALDHVNLPNIWNLQSIPLENEVSTISLVTETGNVYMFATVPSFGVVRVYKYTQFCPESPNGNFTLLHDLEARGVTQVVTFTTAGRKYLAINGLEANVYVLERNEEFSSRLHESLDNVSEWLVVNIDTYRQDVVLLAKTPSGVKALIWDSSSYNFVESRSKMASYIMSESATPVDNGFAMLQTFPWTGAVTIDVGADPAVVFPHDPSAIYRFKVELEPIPNPELEIQVVLTNALPLLKEQIDCLKDNYTRLESILGKSELDYNEVPQTYQRGKNIKEDKFDWLELFQFVSSIQQQADEAQDALDSLENGLRSNTGRYRFTMNKRKNDFKGILVDWDRTENTAFTSELQFGSPLKLNEKQNQTRDIDCSLSEMSAAGNVVFNMTLGTPDLDHAVAVIDTLIVKAHVPFENLQKEFWAPARHIYSPYINHEYRPSGLSHGDLLTMNDLTPEYPKDMPKYLDDF